MKWILTLPDQQFLFPWVALAFDHNQMMMIMLIILKVLLTSVIYGVYGNDDPDADDPRSINSSMPAHFKMPSYQLSIINN